MASCNCWTKNATTLHGTISGVAAVVETSLSGDDVSITLDDSGRYITLKGFDTAPAGSIPFRTAEGLTWILSSSLFPNLTDWASKTELQAVQTSVTTIQTALNLINSKLDLLDSRADLTQTNLSLFNNRLDLMETKVDNNTLNITVINGGSANG